MILLRIFFWIIACYFLYRFIFGFVIPVLLATRNVRAKMKDMRQNMGEFENTNQTTSSSGNGSVNQGTTTSASSSKGDYIDFEEVK